MSLLWRSVTSGVVDEVQRITRRWRRIGTGNVLVSVWREGGESAAEHNSRHPLTTYLVAPPMRKCLPDADADLVESPTSIKRFHQHIHRRLNMAPPGQGGAPHGGALRRLRCSDNPRYDEDTTTEGCAALGASVETLLVDRVGDISAENDSLQQFNAYTVHLMISSFDR